MKKSIALIALISCFSSADKYNVIIKNDNYIIGIAEEDALTGDGPDGIIMIPVAYEVLSGQESGSTGGAFDQDLNTYLNISGVNSCDIAFSYDEAVELHTVNLLAYNSRYGYASFDVSGSNTEDEVKDWNLIVNVPNVTYAINSPSDWTVPTQPQDYDITYNLENTENLKYKFYKIEGLTGAGNAGLGNPGCTMNEITFKS